MLNGACCLVNINNAALSLNFKCAFFGLFDGYRERCPLISIWYAFYSSICILDSEIFLYELNSPPPSSWSLCCHTNEILCLCEQFSETPSTSKSWGCFCLFPAKEGEALSVSTWRGGVRGLPAQFSSDCHRVHSFAFSLCLSQLWHVSCAYFTDRF